MSRLATEPRAFIRPSPSGGFLGGVARKTMESILICEAAGFDVIFVETVGVGQSEIAVSDLVDCMVALLLPGGGDDLQGIKKGLLEHADIVAVNKADGDNISKANNTLADYRSALHCMPLRAGDWQPKALMLSGMTGAGLDDIWQLIIAHRDALLHSKGLEKLRARQRRKWMWAMVQDELTRKIERLKKENDVVNLVETDLHQSKITAAMGAEIIIKQLGF